MAECEEQARTWHAHPQYAVLTALLALLTVWLVLQDGRQPDSGNILMALLAFGLALWHLQWLGSRVETNARELVLYRIGRARQAVAWSAVTNIRWTGRVTRSILVECRRESHREQLELPRLRDQDGLWQQLEGRLGQGES